MLIFFIGGVPSNSFEQPTFLAAQKKMKHIIDLIISLGHEVVFINSAPDMTGNNSRKKLKFKIKENCYIDGFIPKTNRLRKLGRFENIYNATNIFEWVTDCAGLPDLIWAYNGYAFEMKIASYAFTKYKIKTILEFEDWHFARSTFFNIKSVLDWYYWQQSFKSLKSVFYVNNMLAKKVNHIDVPKFFLPGTVSNDIFNLAENSPPFKDNNCQMIKCGYFGGLSTEKGVDFLILLILYSVHKNLPIIWIVTGKGQLSDKLSVISEQHPDQVEFMGTVTDEILTQKIGQVDVILNPHKPNDGVFPFKIAEALSSGRLIISSPVNIAYNASWLYDSLIQLELNVELWIHNIINARSHYETKKNIIEKAICNAKSEVSNNAIKSKIISALK